MSKYRQFATQTYQNTSMLICETHRNGSPVARKQHEQQLVLIVISVDNQQPPHNWVVVIRECNVSNEFIPISTHAFSAHELDICSCGTLSASAPLAAVLQACSLQTVARAITWRAMNTFSEFSASRFVHTLNIAAVLTVDCYLLL